MASNDSRGYNQNTSKWNEAKRCSALNCCLKIKLLWSAIKFACGDMRNWGWTQPFEIFYGPISLTAKLKKLRSVMGGSGSFVMIRCEFCDLWLATFCCSDHKVSRDFFNYLKNLKPHNKLESACNKRLSWHQKRTISKGTISFQRNILFFDSCLAWEICNQKTSFIWR